MLTNCFTYNFEGYYFDFAHSLLSEWQKKKSKILKSMLTASSTSTSASLAQADSAKLKFSSTRLNKVIKQVAVKTGDVKRSELKLKIKSSAPATKQKNRDDNDGNDGNDDDDDDDDDEDDDDDDDDDVFGDSDSHSDNSESCGANRGRGSIHSKISGGHKKNETKCETNEPKALKLIVSTRTTATKEPKPAEHGAIEEDPNKKRDNSLRIPIKSLG